MSEARWTNEQLEAITGRECSMLVAAAAGAGKTAVLVERIIRMITDPDKPVDIDRLLVVTFTNAAAAEMRERIGDAISKELDRNPDSKRLQRQFTLLNKASITTIHSFCLEVIKNNFHCIDLDPGFRIADETEATLMKLEALEETFEEQYANPEGAGDFLQLVECYGGSRDDRFLQDMVLALYDFVQSHPWPELWLKEKTRAFLIEDDVDFAATSWGRILIDNMRIEIDGLHAMMAKAAAIAEKAHGLDTYRANCLDEMDRLSSLSDSLDGTWDEICSAFSGVQFGRLSPCKKDADKEAQQQFKNIRDEVKKRLYKLRDEMFSRNSEAIAGELRTLHPLFECLSRLVLRLGELYSAKKRQKSLVDFNDLEHYCLAILTERVPDLAAEDGMPSFRPSAQARRYVEKFEEVLVDEYQDSNLVQEVILNCISRTQIGSPNIFMVGDVKQSIYRFRQARPELFLEKYRRFSPEKGGKERKIQLYRNFRSRKEVINAVNFIFRQIMSRSIGEMDYTEDEFLNPGFEYGSPEDAGAITGGSVELHMLELSGEYGGSEGLEEGNENGEDMAEPSSQLDNESSSQPDNGISSQPADELLDAIQLEARLAVERIRQLMQADSEGRRFCVYDRKLGEYRNVEFKDIVILLRTTRNWADVFAEELSAAGIPAFADTGTGYFKTIEVQTMLSLLQIIDNPLQDIPMLAVLRSPIAMFSSDALADIRIAQRKGSFYDAMKTHAQGDSPSSIRTREFLQRLKTWREKALYMPTDELIWYLYTDTGYYSYAAAMPGGDQRQANLRILFERARQYEQTTYKGLFNFINFIEKLKSSQGDMGSAKILGENDNVVRIMSIHKSKGLEFPVVIVSGCGKKFNMMDTNRSILVHQDLGFGPDFVDPGRRISYPSLPKLAIRQKIRQETLSEEMRILYVALTRAREKLILTGTVNDRAKKAASWSQRFDSSGARLPEYETSKAGCYFDWLGPAILRHRSGQTLRELAGIDEDIVFMKLSARPEEGWARDIYNDAVEWEIKLWNPADLKLGLEEEMQEPDRSVLKQWLETAGDPAGENGSSEVRRRLEWRYAWDKAARLPVKLSVTELKRGLVTGVDAADDSRRMFETPIIKRPRFMEEDKRFTTAEKGTILHFVMQHIDLKQAAAYAGADSDKGSGKGLQGFLQAQVDDMVRRELLSVSQSEAVDIARIERFFNSEVGQRLLKAERVHREIPFNIEMRCGDIYPDLKDEPCGNEVILLQGVIDCCFEEGGSLVLLDYKTDYIGSESSRQTAEKYRIQIDCYAGALEQLTGKKVKSKYIYLFWNGDTVEM